ncbi:hypothetical protein [Streptomonospora wellingtoniae]|uniref:Uncharacterized protein n=1 Tax=Streptomonospora wellingtoniae TaxID=3075544 RepID=A0ABU2KUQ7_9ACTN|nr:hypothetical protein [Streptomonospora sp. DSM 45055]MDT0302921.1 hypothetical protein [Streptomonospora sp. DSM 45055]
MMSPWDTAAPIAGHLYRRLPDTPLWECWTCRATTPSPIEHGRWHAFECHSLPRTLPLGWRRTYQTDPITGLKADTLTKETT